MGADFTRNAPGRRHAIKAAVLAGLAALLIGFAGRPYLPAAAEWVVRQPLDIALLILGAHGKSREAAACCESRSSNWPSPGDKA